MSNSCSINGNSCLKNKVMKKIYVNPEMDIYEIKTGAQLLAGSPKDAPVDDSDTQDNGDALAPGLLFSIME